MHYKKQEVWVFGAHECMEDGSRKTKVNYARDRDITRQPSVSPERHAAYRTCKRKKSPQMWFCCFKMHWCPGPHPHREEWWQVREHMASVSVYTLLFVTRKNGSNEPNYEKQLYWSWHWKSSGYTWFIQQFPLQTSYYICLLMLAFLVVPEQLLGVAKGPSWEWPFFHTPRDGSEYILVGLAYAICPSLNQSLWQQNEINWQLLRMESQPDRKHMANDGGRSHFSIYHIIHLLKKEGWILGRKKQVHAIQSRFKIKHTHVASCALQDEDSHLRCDRWLQKAQTVQMANLPTWNHRGETQEGRTQKLDT